jgi:thioredoxin 1
MKKILRFTASWCGPCKTMAKQLESINTNIPIEVIDIDVHSDIAVEYGIRGVPTLVMLEDNIEIKRVSGTKPQDQLNEWVNNGN